MLRLFLFTYLLLAGLPGATRLAAQPAAPALPTLLHLPDSTDQQQRGLLPQLSSWLRRHPADNLGQLLAATRLAGYYANRAARDSMGYFIGQAGQAARRLAPAYPLERAMLLRHQADYLAQSTASDSSLRYYAQAARLLQAGYRRRRTPDRLADGRPLLVGDELADAYTQQGIVLNYSGHIRASIAYFEQAIRYHREMGNPLEAAAVLRRVGIIYSKLGQDADARRCLAQVLAVGQQQADPTTAAMVTASVVDTYLTLTLTPAERRQLLADIKAVQQRLRPVLPQAGAQLLSQAARLAMFEAELAGSVRQEQALHRADLLMRQFRRVASQRELTEWEYHANRIMYYCYRLKRHPEEADAAVAQLDSLAIPLQRAQLTAELLPFLNEAHLPGRTVALAQPLLASPLLRTNLSVRRLALLNTADAYAQLRQYQSALVYRLRYDTLNDSLRSRQQLAAVNGLEVRYRTAEKERRIEQLTQQRQLDHQQRTQQQAQQRWLLLAVASLLAGLALFGWLYRRLRLAQARALVAIRAKDTLYAIIGHDLRSPLTAFAGLADMLDLYRRHGDLTGLGELTAEVRHTGNRLASLLDNLLHWAAAETGELTPHFESLPLARLLPEVTDLYAPAAQARQVHLVVEAPAPDLCAYADRNMTLTILRNLVGNALQVAPPGSAITLAATSAPGRQVRLWVQDDGPGLRPEQVAALLAGAAASPARRPGGPARGTGLGLPLVRRLVSLQRGQVAFDSRPGEGSTVSVVLPQG